MDRLEWQKTEKSRHFITPVGANGAIILFTVGGVIVMETECLWLIFGVCRTQILPLLDPRV